MAKCSMSKKIEKLAKKKEAYDSYNEVFKFVEDHPSWRYLVSDIAQMCVRARSIANEENLKYAKGRDKAVIRNKIRDISLNNSAAFDLVKTHILQIVDGFLDANMD